MAAPEDQALAAPGSQTTGAPPADDGRLTSAVVVVALVSAISGLLYGFLYRRMPELTGRSLEQIEMRLSEGRFRPADFAGAR